MTNINIAGYKVKYNPNNDVEIVCTSPMLKTKEEALQWASTNLKKQELFKIVPYYASNDYEHY